MSYYNIVGASVMIPKRTTVGHSVDVDKSDNIGAVIRYVIHSLLFQISSYNVFENSFKNR